MRKESQRLDLSRLARKKITKIAAMLKELEGDSSATTAQAPDWPARFLAVGGKRAAQRS
jgi:hypothetical protein